MWQYFLLGIIFAWFIYKILLWRETWGLGWFEVMKRILKFIAILVVIVIATIFNPALGALIGAIVFYIKFFKVN